MPGQNLTRVEAAQRADIITTHTYRVELDLRGDTTFRSQTNVKFSALHGASTFIDLIAQSVEKIVLNGVEIPTSAYSDSRIALENLADENELYVDATCVYSHTGEGLHRAIDPADNEVYLYSQFEVPDSRRMYAVFEQPDLKAEFTFVVTAPKHWKVFSVSPTPQPTAAEEGFATWEFSPTEPISSYLTCIIAGPYEGVTDSHPSSDGRTIPMGVYARKSLAEYLDGDEIITITKQAMDFFEDAWDVPYPFRKYDQIFVPEYNAGAMEHPGCVTILDDYVFRSRPTEALVERRAITVVHELAHMWFGDLVTMKWWDDLWLNESFAEFTSHVATAEATRWSDAWVTFNSSEKSWAQMQDQLPSTHPIAADIRDLEDVQVNFDGITYGKGASVFQQLVAYVGRDAFFTGVSKYLKKKAWGNATLDDLLVELSAASGRDLTEWVKVWLQESGINILRPRLTMDGGTLSEMVIEQGTDGRASMRPHRIGVGGYSLNDEGKLVRVAHTELDIDGAETVVPAFSGIERPELILINDGDLAYAKVRMDDESLAFAIKHINAFSDRLARTLVLFSAWDMTRDGEMPASDYVELVLKALETEDHGTVLRSLINSLSTAVKLYSAPAKRSALQEKVGQRLAELARDAQTGTDRQFQLAMASVSLAYTDAQIDTVAGWLEGRDVLDGLSVDANFRWGILARLAASGRVDADVIERERTERDNTASGAAHAARARAALSSAEAKEAAWRDITGGEVPNSIQRSAALGFTDGDPQLLVAFVDRYFDNIESQWADRTVEIASNFIAHAFPTVLTGRDDLGVDIVARGQEWLANHTEAAPASRRLFSEALAHAERAARAQQADA
ncbi:aminopeptidase N [Arcanobacterium pinnipediorum]|uniref:Aminopeptidase N n=1 Tax=Arcanobacterium pinnipediorum TaxID=1503041 RepID=A0ABY5AIX8_9ACTO|nr:aminopeptidase N [Arcanobacterium pinnipediorum]USR79815.1 aminopeptidase N [Arcanobacterium pinnipediorum]